VWFLLLDGCRGRPDYGRSYSDYDSDRNFHEAVQGYDRGRRRCFGKYDDGERDGREAVGSLEPAQGANDAEEEYSEGKHPPDWRKVACENAAGERSKDGAEKAVSGKF
jgi:hypothetical protein